MAKTIFISGASRGFGKLWAEALLQRGDKVIATARDLRTLDDLVSKYGDNILPLRLDVNAVMKRRFQSISRRTSLPRPALAVGGEAR